MICNPQRLQHSRNNNKIGITNNSAIIGGLILSAFFFLVPPAVAGDPVSTGRMLNDSDDTEDVDMTGDCVFLLL